MIGRAIDQVPPMLDPEVLAEIEAHAPGAMEILRTAESEETRTMAGAMLFFAGYRNGVESVEPEARVASNIPAQSNGHKSRKR